VVRVAGRVADANPACGKAWIRRTCGVRSSLGAFDLGKFPRPIPPQVAQLQAAAQLSFPIPHSPFPALMHCPFCQHADTRVIDSRVSEDGATIRRRRECEACGERCSTLETIELKLPAIIKSDG